MSADRRSTRITALIVAGALVWLLVLTVAWAARPLSDTIVVGVDEDGRRITVDVECNTLFDADPVDGAALAVIDAVDPAIAAQAPCESVHSQARLLALINVALVIAVIAGALVVAARRRRVAAGRDDTASDPVASAG